MKLISATIYLNLSLAIYFYIKIKVICSFS